MFPRKPIDLDYFIVRKFSRHREALAEVLPLAQFGKILFHNRQIWNTGSSFLKVKLSCNDEEEKALYYQARLVMLSTVPQGDDIGSAAAKSSTDPFYFNPEGRLNIDWHLEGLFVLHRSGIPWGLTWLIWLNLIYE